MSRAVILGIGNMLLTDDGAGVHAAHLLADLLAGRRDVEVLDAGTLSFTLAPRLAGVRRLIVLDAARLGTPAGTVRCYFGTDIDALLARARPSVHDLGLRDLLGIARVTGTLPAERALIAIEPHSLDWGTEPSPAVSAAILSAARMARELIDVWPASAAAAA